MYQEHTLLFMEGKYKYVAPGCAERRYPRHITTRAGNLQDAQRCHAWKLIWKTWAPPRVKLFLWLANKDRCWTAEWLQQRHLQNNRCVMCDQQLETIHHLLVSCPFSRQIWYDTLSWLRLACRPPDQDDSISHWWLDVRQNTPKAMRKGFATATHLTVWMIWKHRNGCVFDGDQPSKPRLNDSIRNEAAMWARAGAAGLRVILPTTWDVH
jgi:hypothetical protein